MRKVGQSSLEGVKSLSEAQVDALQWAKDFMDNYERKHKLGKFSR